MKKIRPGDIVLYKVTPNSPIHDKLIGIGERLLHKNFTKTSYCHVSMIDFDTDFILEAVWPKTHIIKFPGKTSNPVEIYRVKKATKKQISTAIKWAHSNLGLWYNIGLLLFGLFPKKHEVICSTYVANAFKAAGIKLGKNEKLLSPDEIAANTIVLERII
jgi:uncharacterized protein YycO